MNKSDIVLVLRFQNIERFINKYLHYNIPQFDCFIAIDDRSKSHKIYDKLYHHPQCAAIIRKNKKAQFSEVCDQETLHTLSVSSGKKYMFYLDADEIISPEFTNELPSIPSTHDLYKFPFITLYPDEYHRIVSGIYGNRTLNAMFKLNPDNHYSIVDRNKLHGSRFPFKEEAVYKVESPIYHFGLTSESIREQRYLFYQEYDPKLIYQPRGYEHLLTKHKYEKLDFQFENNSESIGWVKRAFKNTVDFLRKHGSE